MNTAPPAETAPASGGRSAGSLFVAIDIGASSGRVILGRVAGTSGATRAELETVHRFPNGVKELDGGLRWDFEALFAEVLSGLAAAATAAAAGGESIASIGIDTWAVDYGLINDAGGLLAAPFSYRDERPSGAVARVHQKLDPARLYATTGLQFLPFNTIYQLAAEPDLDGLQALLIPDLIGFLLPGQRRTEATNASTTGLFDAVAGEWATEFLAALGLPAGLFPPLIQPGETLGTLTKDVADRPGLAETTAVVAVGSHDTASAVAAVPAGAGGDQEQFAYISPGTWSLVGVELSHPVLTEASRALNFTNERGVDGAIRYLRNVGGLWLLSECQRTWAAEGYRPELGELLDAAATLPPGGPVINAEDPYFIAPDNMPERIRAAVRNTGAVVPERSAHIVRCILDSLAAGYARTIADAERLADVRAGVVHIVGGGSQNRLLCQLTADATGKPVLVQARAAGALGGGLDALRSVVRASQQPVEYVPSRRTEHEPAARSVSRGCAL